MTNRARSIPELPNLAAPSSDDLLVIVDDPAVTANTKKVTVAALFNNSNASITLSNTAVLTANTVIVKNKMTPANSLTTTITGGTIFFDDNYIYVAISNNVVKRASLSSF